MKITRMEISDLRFPTSLTSDGTDAVHKDPDYSAAYVILHTDEAPEGHGFTFTIGRGNEICAAAIRAFEPLVVGRSLDEIFDQPAAFWRSLAGDSQLRWLGPEKGVIHISMAAIVNAGGARKRVAPACGGGGRAPRGGWGRRAGSKSRCGSC